MAVGMIWLGLIIGFCIGVVFITLCYVPLVDKVNALQAKLVSDQVLIDDAVNTLRALEERNEHLRKDLELVQKWIPREVLAQFFDAPYRN
jgi:hypothetical protein